MSAREERDQVDSIEWPALDLRRPGRGEGVGFTCKPWEANSRTGSLPQFRHDTTLRIFDANVARWNCDYTTITAFKTAGSGSNCHDSAITALNTGETGRNLNCPAIPAAHPQRLRWRGGMAFIRGALDGPEWMV